MTCAFAFPSEKKKTYLSCLVGSEVGNVVDLELEGLEPAFARSPIGWVKGAFRFATTRFGDVCLVP